jgi:hypothetical protein
VCLKKMWSSRWTQHIALHSNIAVISYLSSILTSSTLLRCPSYYFCCINELSSSVKKLLLVVFSWVNVIRNHLHSRSLFKTQFANENANAISIIYISLFH